MKRTHKLLSILLTLALLLGMLPMTAAATGPTEIEELSLSFINPSEIPAVGGNIRYRTNGRLQENDDRIDLTGNELIWNIDDSAVTVNPSDLDTGMYFEAGRSYNATFILSVLDPDQYTITENTDIKFTDSVGFTYTSELSEIVETESSCYAYMKLTITMAGERTYPDIGKVVFKDFAGPADGMAKSACGTDIYYNNCEMTSGTWLGDVWGDGDTFVAGETYTYHVVLNARDGYKFDEDATVILTNGESKEPSYRILGDENRTLTLEYTYTIPGITWLDAVDATITRHEYDLTPIAGESAISLFTDTLAVDENAPYEIVERLDRPWYSEDGTMLTNDDQFVAGKTYYFDYAYSIKTECEAQYRFVADGLTTTITGNSYTGAGFQKAERMETDNLDNTYVQFRYYFTAQFPAGAGSSAGNPAMCYSYEEFKYAMESSNIRYVALGNVDDMLPLIPHDEEQDPGGITQTAIVVRGNKDLNLLGNAVFSCPLTGNYDLKYYIQLLTLTDAANSSLYIHGPGSLTYAGGTLNFVNSVIKMEGGHLTVDGTTIRGSNGYHTAFCYGINAIFGSVSIQGGATVIGEIYGGEGGISALTLGSEGVNRSLSVSILDGKFYVERDEGDSDEDHGIMVNNDIGLRIYGMSTDGIRLGRDAADTLADYVADGCAMTVNGVNTDPASCGTTNGFVEVYQEISNINIHVNSPVAGESPAIYDSEVYLVPEGATVESITWYENDQLWNISSGSARFTAGNTYKVEITLVADEGVKFANPLTSATVNSKNATVSAFAGNWEKGITLTVELGECPNVVPEVELTVTAPKEGNNPSYTIGCGSDAYYAVGGSSNYTEYRQWYESSNGYDGWTEMETTDTFEAGKYYKVYVDIRTNEGYEFPLVDVGTIQPDVTATVNSYSANVIKAYEQDPSRYITVEYNFGECSDSIVERITVENVVAPVAGQKPTYTYSIRGGGYQMDTSRNAYYDDWMHNQKLYYVKNGISWWDTTTGSWEYVYENSTFVPGHTYACQLYLEADTALGYTFANDDGTPTVTATINGNAAEINTGWTNATEARVFYTFTCTQPEVSTIMLYDLDEPQAGKTPDTEVTAAYPELYVIDSDSIRWLDEEDGEVNAFEQGRLYTVEITVAAKDYEGVDGCIFADEVTAYIDGTEVTGWTNSVTTNNDNTVTIRYAFRKGAAAPEAPSGTTVSGTAVSWNDTDDAVYLLYSSSTADSTIKAEWSAGSYNALYTATKGSITDTTVDNKSMKSQTFTFEDVEMGIYKLVILKPGKYVPKIVEVTVTGSSLEVGQQKLWLYGDVNGDGTVNGNDIQRLYAHITGTTVIVDPDALIVSDANEDGSINGNDIQRIYAHITGTTVFPG